MDVGIIQNTVALGAYYHRHRILPGALGAAMLLHQRGMLNPDNNPVERSIRPVVIGRKNYLFAGSHQAAQRLAMIYSLLGTCKLNDVNPYAWLKDVFDKINSWPINRIHELLPHNWEKTCANSVA